MPFVAMRGTLNLLNKLAGWRLLEQLVWSPSMSVRPLITTYLEMHSIQELRVARGGNVDQITVRESDDRSGAVNRSFYRAVGEMWTWHDKKHWTDADWRTYAADPRLRTWIASVAEKEAGYFELHQDDAGGVEIAYFGLLPAFIGKGLGGALLTVCLKQAWQTQPARVWVHTCSLDHPAALENYRARGMKVYRVEESQVPVNESASNSV